MNRGQVRTRPQKQSRFLPLLLAGASLLVLWLGGSPLSAQARNKNFTAGKKAMAARQFVSARLLFEEVLRESPDGEFGDDSQYYIGLSYFLENNYELALFEFQKLSNNYPTSPRIPDAEFFRAECYYYQEKLSPALKAHLAFAGDYPGHKFAPRALYSAGYIRMRQGVYPEAIDLFARALKKYPRASLTPEIHLKLGESYFNNKDYDQARKIFQEIILKGKSEIYRASELLDDAQFWIGKAWFAEEKFAESRRQFQLLLNKFPKGDVAPNSLYYIALSYFQEKKTFEGLQALRKLREQYPKSPLAPASWYREGEVHRLVKKDKLAAMAAYRKVVEDYPQSRWAPEALRALGETLLQSGNTKGALGLFKQVIKEKKFKPAYIARAINRSGDIYYNQGDYKTAWEHYARVIQDYPLAPDAPEAVHQGARTLVKLGQPETALELLKKGSDRYQDPKTQIRYELLRADIYFQTRDYRGALGTYRKLLKKNISVKQRFAARMGIAYSYFEQKQYTRAQDHFTKILRDKKFQKLKELDETRLALASCQYNLRQFDRARDNLNQVYQNKASQYRPAARFELGWLEYRLKKFEKSARVFGAFPEEFPENTRVPEAIYYQAWSRTKQNKQSRALDIFEKLVEMSIPAAVEKNAQRKPTVLAGWKKNLSRFQPLAIFYSGRILGVRGQSRRAIQSYSRLLKEYPENEVASQARYELAMEYLKSDRQSAALRAIRRLEQKEPESPLVAEFYFALAGRLKVAGKNNEAARYYEYIRKNFQKSDLAAGAMYELIRNRMEGRYYSRAGKLADAFIQKYPSKPEVDDVYLLRGDIRLKMGQPKKALEAWERAFMKMVADRRHEARLRIARFYYNKKDYKAALEELVELAKRPAAAGEAYFLRGKIAINQGKEATAMDLFRLSEKRGSGRWVARSLMERGNYYLTQKEFKKATLAFVKIIHTFSQYQVEVSEALYGAVRAFRGLGNNAEAGKYKATLLKEYPGSPWAVKVKNL